MKKNISVDVTDHGDYGTFSTLHTRLHADQITAFSHTPTGHGYLYGDNPWSSRDAPQIYLKRLQMLKTSLV